MISIERIRGILLQPQIEWLAIGDEQTSAAALYRHYVVPLAAIGPVATFIGFSLIGIGIPLAGPFRIPIGVGLVSAAVAFIMALVGVFLMAHIINALAPTFNGSKDTMQALKLAVYASTPAWLAGIFQVLPTLAILAAVLSLYSLYLLYVGLPMLMKAPRERALAYTAVVVLCAIVLYVVIGAVTAGIGGMGNSSRIATASHVEQGDAVAQLRQLGATMEAAGRQLEQAQQSDDAAGGIVVTGAEAFGELAGSVQFEPVDHALLKAMLPAQLVGMQRTQLESSRNGMAGIAVSNAEGNFRDDADREITLSLTDMGGGRGLGMLASWALLEQERESAEGYEKTVRAGNRIIHEEYDRDARTGTYQVLVGNRFIAEARGYGVDMAMLRMALTKVDLDKLDSIKTQGARK